MTDNYTLEIYLAFIKKAAANKMWDRELQDDVVQDVFIKLHNKDFFNENDLEDGKVSKQAGVYIYTTVKRHSIDVYRKRNPKDSITDSINIDSDDEFSAKELPSLDMGIEESCLVSEEAKNAYSAIMNCFELSLKLVKGEEKLTFFYTAFWELSDFGMTIKELAKHLGFVNSNPTQEFNRFVSKVSNCTEKNGVKLTKPNEQVEILFDLMGVVGA
jgi:DNA-directed RNA polymerase specialized sigma24 family protein